MRRVSRRLVVLPVLAASVLGISAIGATAKTSPVPVKHKLVRITGGSTTITANSATVTFLAKHNVTPTAIAPATLSGASVTLPVKGGVAVKKNLDGILLHRGAVKFSTTKRSVTLRHITLWKAGKRAHVSALVAGHVITLASVSDLKA